MARRTARYLLSLRKTRRWYSDATCARNAGCVPERRRRRPFAIVPRRASRRYSIRTALLTRHHLPVRERRKSYVPSAAFTSTVSGVFETFPYSGGIGRFFS